MAEEEQKKEEISDEEALMKIASMMKDNATSLDDKQNVFTFLWNVAQAKGFNLNKLGNLRDDKELNELGIPELTVRGDLSLALVSNHIMDNSYFSEFFEKDAENTLATSLSREGFLVRHATVQTKQVADITKRRKINKGMFGKKNIEEQGGDTIVNTNG